jgi:hypothetical protein
LAHRPAVLAILAPASRSRGEPANAARSLTQQVG